MLGSDAPPPAPAPRLVDGGLVRGIESMRVDQICCRAPSATGPRQDRRHGGVCCWRMPHLNAAAGCRTRLESGRRRWTARRCPCRSGRRPATGDRPQRSAGGHAERHRRVARRKLSRRPGCEQHGRAAPILEQGARRGCQHSMQAPAGARLDQKVSGAAVQLLGGSPTNSQRITSCCGAATGTPVAGFQWRWLSLRNRRLTDAPGS